MRLDKFLSDLGIASRRKIVHLIKSGKVKINGKKVTNCGIKVNPDLDLIEVEGILVTALPKKHYYKFYKPKGYITSKADKAPTVMDLLPSDLPGLKKIFPVGRLDKDAEGLLIFTDDGLLAHRIMHPKWKLTKTYYVQIDKEITEKDLEKLEEGIELSDGRTLPCKISILDLTRKFLQVKVKEGRYHLIKRMFGKLGYKVLELKRIAIGPIKLGDLKPSQIIPLSSEEIRLLKEAVGLKD
ncbi:pseudouridine synthase Rsu [Thermodesulfobacterium geofontis OPF15]|uniref:Pseudouridine synthase n=1 Tax=Thermodesulfobacterium geofontis (strain OPF15) TaxID=795359 RepID=F8C660_THEGP|nr:pseudouridine synthase [Thermodesulfobacterium geofontis]AEH23211.1 pseudouridine synthase Rsu [Thermodesulfobacterium geofontis OPF15]